MKIAYLSSSTIPSRAANSVQVMKMCHAFCKNGHDVTLYSPNKKKKLEKRVNDIYKFYGVDKSFEIKKFIQPSIKGFGRIYSFLAAIDSKKKNHDLAYGRNLTACYFSSLFGLPTLYESHEPINNKISKLLFLRLINHSNFKQLIVITESLKEHYLNKYELNSNQIKVAYDAADIPDELDESEKLNLDTNRFHVGYIGQLYKGKGMTIISQLIKKCSWAEFHIVGGIDKDINYWKNRLDTNDNVRFYGYVPNSQTSKYRQAFDVVLAPYKNEVYGYGGGNDISNWMSPLKIFEYMAAGKPIIASELPVLKEVLIHEVNSLLCSPQNIEDWVEAIEILKNDKKLRDKLSKRARKDFVENYTWNIRAKKVLEELI